MYFSVSSILLGLAATASAIDIRAHIGSSCAGAYVACVNINPNVCCSFSSSGSSGRSSISVVAVRETSFSQLTKVSELMNGDQIPSNWRIRAEAYTGGGCSFTGGQYDSNGGTTICLPYTTRGDRTGGKYWFLNRKRADDLSCPAEQPGAGKCEAVVKPDVLGLADGTAYNIADLADEKVQELEKIAETGAGADAVPAEFQTLQIEA
ncbi:hypothetical protein K4K54_004980 [Colletotrichum sp. SAR 10_86]|nr:hypothetical protein KHU50_004082 [Colletotrichum sp. SAR 10_65]KAI8224821.1 hypothetical protein K4K54_004980 [Colletotrichum sp. SAR 10_86]KAI8242891.1 hypothetical protein K4K53_003518 [Colletotrichum sp. SAR 10_77]KAJ5008575.1 hypothetical protein K4K48_000134 [Colletotrichum sp. SAR 10_66]